MSHTLYPKRCVPRKGYKLISRESIPLLRNKYVIRYSEGDVPLKDKNSLESNLETNMASSKFRTGLSVTLLGVSIMEDAKYIIKKEQKDKYSKEWVPGEMVLRVKKEDFTYNPQRGFYGLLIDTILTCFIDLPIIKSDNTTERVDLVKYEIVHCPTHCNFWHFCIYPYGINKITGEKYYLRDDKPTKNGAKNATRNIASELKKFAVLSDSIVERPIKAALYRD